ncbi:LysR substrate-binding domain-containing protein [Rhizobium subbaraonis]|nr:LysR substrate-binding domain-containing protein [Rhizobium subbaraonis]
MFCLREAWQDRSFAAAIRGALRVGSIPNGITGILPRILMACSEQHPDLVIDIAPARSLDLYSRVLDGQLDGAIIVRPPFQLASWAGSCCARSR